MRAPTSPSNAPGAKFHPWSRPISPSRARVSAFEERERRKMSALAAAIAAEEAERKPEPVPAYQRVAFDRVVFNATRRVEPTEDE